MKNKFSLITMLLVLLLTACAAPMDLAKKITFWGDPATPSFADRTITINQNTTYVNVTGGYNFDLKLVAPEGMLDHTVMAYVQPDPRFAGGR